MKAGNLFLTISIPVVILATMLLIDWAGKQEPVTKTECKKVERIPVTGTFIFDYCPELDKVRYDTTWIEPGRFERRRIKIAERKGYGGW